MSRTAWPRSPRANDFMTMIVPERWRGYCSARSMKKMLHASPGAVAIPSCTSRGGSGGEVGLDLPEDGFLALRPDHAGLLLPILEQDQGRDAHHAELPSRLGVVVDVQLGGPQPVRVIPSDLFDHRGHHVARHTPFRPEIDQDRAIGPEDLFFEGLFGHLYDNVIH